MLTQHSPPTVSQQALEDVADKLLELYPDDPALGSPFGTGDELFGWPSSFKRRAALGMANSRAREVPRFDKFWQWATCGSLEHGAGGLKLPPTLAWSRMRINLLSLRA